MSLDLDATVAKSGRPQFGAEAKASRLIEPFTLASGSHC